MKKRYWQTKRCLMYLFRNGCMYIIYYSFHCFLLVRGNWIMNFGLYFFFKQIFFQSISLWMPDIINMKNIIIIRVPMWLYNIFFQPFVIKFCQLSFLKRKPV